MIRRARHLGQRSLPSRLRLRHAQDPGVSRRALASGERLKPTVGSATVAHRRFGSSMNANECELHPTENPDRYLLRMTSATDMPRLRTHRVAIWLLTLYIAACVVVSGCIPWSPWLHLVLEHGSLNQRHAHRHLPVARSSAPQDPFAGFPKSAQSGAPSHPHPHPHSHAGTSPGSPAPESLPTTPDHTHHGLPQLLASGLLELSDAGVIPVHCSQEYRADLADSGDRPRLVAVFDLTQAARPPPLRHSP